MVYIKLVKNNKFKKELYTGQWKYGSSSKGNFFPQNSVSWHRDFMPIHNCRNNVQKTHGRPIQMSIMIFWLWRVRNHQRFLNTWIHNLFSQLSSKLYYLLYSSNFLFLFFDRFWRRSYKIWKYYVILVYNLQGKMGKMEKNWKENQETKVIKIPKTKRRIYGMNETSSVGLYGISSDSDSKN